MLQDRRDVGFYAKQLFSRRCASVVVVFVLLGPALFFPLIRVAGNPVAQSDQVPAAPATAVDDAAAPATAVDDAAGAEEDATTSFRGALSLLERSWEGGVVVFAVLVVLLFFSVMSWALALYKVLSLRRTQRICRNFLRGFWDHNSLNDFHDKLPDYPLSPIKEAFVAGYDELSKSLPLAAQHAGSYRILRSSMDRIARSLRKSRYASRKDMEVFLLFLAISASVAPFVGLLGTVWGIMNAFEGIAQTGSASLAVVAPGISEALVATAFGLIAAIPALIGYNIAQHHIRRTLGYVDEFSSDFMNIVERYLVSRPTNSETAPIRQKAGL